MRRSKIFLFSMLSILFYSLMVMKPSAEIAFDIEESVVCNIYYKIPKELRSSQKLLLKNSKGEVVGVLELDGDSDTIFFENVPFGEYYIEVVGCGLAGNCFPIVLGKSSLYGAHIKKDLDVEYNLFTEEQAKVIIGLGYSGTEVTEDILKEVAKVLGPSGGRYPNHHYLEESKPVEKPSKPSNLNNLNSVNSVTNNDSNVSYNYDNYANKDNYEKNENSENGYLDNSQNLDNSNNSSKPNDVNNSNDGSDVGSSNDVGNPSKPGNHLLIPHSIIPALIVIAVLLLLLIPLGLFILFHRKKEDKDEEVS